MVIGTSLNIVKTRDNEYTAPSIMSDSMNQEQDKSQVKSQIWKPGFSSDAATNVWTYVPCLKRKRKANWRLSLA